MTSEHSDVRFGENEGEQTAEGNLKSSTDSSFTWDIYKKVYTAIAESAYLKQT